MRFSSKNLSLKFWRGWNKKDNLIKLYIVVWPTIIGLFWNDYNKQISRSTELIFNWEKSIDLIALIFWICTFLWFFFFFFSVLIEDESINKKFDRIRATILKAPDIKAIYNARSIFDFVFNIIDSQLKPMQSAILNEIASAQSLIQSGQIINPAVHLTKKNDLKAALMTINNSLLQLATRFYKSASIDGVNIMLFFPNDAANKDIIEKLCNISTQLYMRCDHKNDLEGILFLEKGFYSKKNNVLNNSHLVIPVYKQYIEVYKNPNEEQVECIIPGAMLAYKLGSAMVGDTRDLKKYYSTLDERTQKEIKEFWHNDVVGKEIRSFSSFKTPGTISNPSENIGILNFDSKLPDEFGKEDEEFFASFYILIHPMLKISAEYLSLYREYIKLTY